MRGMLHAEVAGHGKIRVRTRLEPNLREGPGSSAATSGEQGRDDRTVIQKDNSACGCRGLGRQGIRKRGFAEKLAMSGVAEIKMTVAPQRGQIIGTRGNCLGFQSLTRSPGRALCGHRRGDGRFQFHFHYRYQFVGLALYGQPAAKAARDLARDG
jgi:hypothetical protein